MKVLHVEDEEADAFFVERALRNVVEDLKIHHVHSGQEAIAYLSGQGKYADREAFPLPELMILDVKMFGVNGFDLLEWVGSRKEFEGIRRVVLTSSNDRRDHELATTLGAHGFLVKEIGYEQLCAWVRDGAGNGANLARRKA